MSCSHYHEKMYLLNMPSENRDQIVHLQSDQCHYYPPVPALVAHLDVHPFGDQEVAGSTPASRQHSLEEIDHEIFSMVILSLLLIQEWQLSVSGERICTILVNRLEV